MSAWSGSLGIGPGFLEDHAHEPAAMSRGCPLSPRSCSVSVRDSSSRPFRGSAGSRSSGSQVLAANARQMAPWAEPLRRLDTVPGINQRTAEVILAEVGADMSVFPSARHLASWAALCPGHHESGQTQVGQDPEGQPMAANGADRGGGGGEPGQAQRAASPLPPGAAASRAEESRRGGGTRPVAHGLPRPR
jgi:hypothetical protein